MTHSLNLSDQLLVEAKFENRALPDVAAETTARLNADFARENWTGRRVAVAAGSRGIDKLAEVVRATIAFLKARGAQPIVVPAMGSHGGATAEGQVEMLASLGVTSEVIDAPIECSMETIEIGRTRGGVRVFVGRTAAEADAVLLINRVKPHTDFASDLIGSGVRKMAVIGLGKADSSFECHRAVSHAGYESVMLEVSEFVLGKLPRVYGLALIEDSYHHLAEIAPLKGPEIIELEPALLRKAREWMPSLPFREIDVLILDQIGKNISGAGMDPNITGRGSSGGARPDSRVSVRRIYVRGLTPESHGNAIGMGAADVVSAKLVAEIDARSTFTNALSAMTPNSVKTPMHFASDRECLSAALRLADADPVNARIVRVRNTLALDRFIASANYAKEIEERDDLRVLRSASAWGFTPEGDLDSVI
jgi:hypothetical protein